MKLLVAATDNSGPAISGRVTSAIASRGDPGALTRAMTKAPAALAVSTDLIRSGLLPDCETARHTTFSRSSLAS